MYSRAVNYRHWHKRVVPWALLPFFLTMTNWEDIAELLELVFQVKLSQWQCALPALDSLPNASLEQAVDEWCLIFSKDMVAEVRPPAEVGPWVLARFLMVSVCARELEGNALAPMPEMSLKTLRQFMIGEWHGALRERWNMMVTYGLPEV